jgi:hypothetical protein
MQIKGEQLAAHLERGLQAVYLVYGDEPLLVIEAADAIRAAARRRGFDEREVLTAIAGFNWNDLYHAAGSRSLFGGRTLIDLRVPTGKPGREGSAALQAYCTRPSPDSLLLVSMTGVDWREEKAAWMSAMLAAGAIVKLVPPGLAQLPAWIAGRLGRQQQSASADGLLFIAERVEGNLLAAHQEILKLGVLYAEGALSVEQIRNAVLNVARYDLDGLREALLAGDVARLDAHPRRPAAGRRGAAAGSLGDDRGSARPGADQGRTRPPPAAGCAAQGSPPVGNAPGADQTRLQRLDAERVQAALRHACAHRPDDQGNRQRRRLGRVPPAGLCRSPPPETAAAGRRFRSGLSLRGRSPGDRRRAPDAPTDNRFRPARR